MTSSTRTTFSAGSSSWPWRWASSARAWPLGCVSSGIEVFDGWDLLDNVPVEIQRGAVDTTRYGSGYWTIQGVEYRLEPDGHDELTLAIKPREDTTAP